MEIGRMRHRLKLYTVTSTKNDLNEDVLSDNLERTVWCSIKPIAGDEAIFGYKVVSGTTHVITMRYQKPNTKEITSSWFGVNDNKTYEFISILNILEKDNYLVIQAKVRNG